jgi:hypothetical protein
MAKGYDIGFVVQIFEGTGDSEAETAEMLSLF